MKKLMIATITVLLISGIAYGQEAWYEAAESCAVDYEIAISRNVPAQRPARNDSVQKDLVRVAKSVDNKIVEMDKGRRLDKVVIDKVSRINREAATPTIDVPTINTPTPPIDSGGAFTDGSQPGVQNIGDVAPTTLGNLPDKGGVRPLNPAIKVNPPSGGGRIRR